MSLRGGTDRECSLELKLAPLSVVVVHLEHRFNQHSSFGLYHRCAVFGRESYILHFLLGVELDCGNRLRGIRVVWREGGEMEKDKESEKQDGKWLEKCKKIFNYADKICLFYFLETLAS